MLKNILEKDIMQMLRLSTTLLTENPLPLNKAASAQNISVKTIRRLLSSYLNEGTFVQTVICSNQPVAPSPIWK